MARCYFERDFHGAKRWLFRIAATSVGLGIPAIVLTYIAAPQIPNNRVSKGIRDTKPGVYRTNLGCRAILDWFGHWDSG